MKKSLYFIFLLLMLVNACKQQQTIKSIEKIPSGDVSLLSPKQVVILYFQAWNDKKYDVMYSLISDGFKQIEPTAATLDDFRLYMSSFFETSSGINILNMEGAYQNENGAGINYKIEIINKDGTKKEFSSAYTLKKRANGWKLIHPYGENIDTA